MKIKVFVIGVLILSYFSAAALKSASEFSGVPARGVVVHRKEDAAFIQEEKRLAKEEGILQAAIEAARRGIQIGLGDEIIAKIVELPIQKVRALRADKSVPSS